MGGCEEAQCLTEYYKFYSLEMQLWFACVLDECGCSTSSTYILEWLCILLWSLAGRNNDMWSLDIHFLSNINLFFNYIWL